MKCCSTTAGEEKARTLRLLYYNNMDVDRPFNITISRRRIMNTNQDVNLSTCITKQWGDFFDSKENKACGTVCEKEEGEEEGRESREKMERRGFGAVFKQHKQSYSLNVQALRSMKEKYIP